MYFLKRTFKIAKKIIIWKVLVNLNHNFYYKIHFYTLFPITSIEPN